jgi:uncharacterized SAM-binding protein YcdF (DUF218 family)
LELYLDPTMQAERLRKMTTVSTHASLRSSFDTQARLRACLGGACALLAWLALGELTGVGKTPSLLYPLAVVATLLGALVALTRAAVMVWIGTAAALGLFCIVALTPLVTTVLPRKDLIRNEVLPQRPLDAVVVLSGGITPDSLLMAEAVDRLLTGLALMRDSVAPLLVVTQPRRPDGVTAAPDQARLRALVARPFPMLTVDSVHTTHDEAVRAWTLVRARGVKRIAVVTSPLHTARACATFERVGFTVTCVAAVSRFYSIDHAGSGGDRLVLFRVWLYERAAWVEYRARGWVTR